MISYITRYMVCCWSSSTDKYEAVSRKSHGVPFANNGASYVFLLSITGFIPTVLPVRRIMGYWKSGNDMDSLFHERNILDLSRMGMMHVLTTPNKISASAASFFLAFLLQYILQGPPAIDNAPLSSCSHATNVIGILPLLTMHQSNDYPDNHRYPPHHANIHPRPTDESCAAPDIESSM